MKRYKLSEDVFGRVDFNLNIKMGNMKKVLCFLLILFCVSCKQTHVKTDGILKISLKEISSSPLHEKLYLEDLKASITAIPLETKDSCLLNKISQILDIDYFWIVADRQVYKFKKDGSFIQRIGQKGQGPKEYIAAEQIQVDREQKLIYVLDYFGRKLIAFDYNGKFFNSWKLPEDYSLNRIAFHNNKIYYTSFANSVSPDVLAYNFPTNKMDTISIHDRVMGQEAYTGETFIYNLRGKTYLYHYFNDTVYSLGKKLSPSFLINIGDSKFTYKQLTITGDYTSEEPIDKPKIQITNFIDLENYILMSYSVINSWKPTKEKDNRFALYDKSSNNMYSDICLVNKKDPLFSINPQDPIFSSSDEHSIYTYKMPVDLIQNPQFEKLNAESNPIIIKYEFKQKK